MKAVKTLISLGVAIATLILLQWPGTVAAKDVAEEHSIADAMATPTATALTGVSFYWGESPHPEVKKVIGTYASRRATNAFGKSAARSCQWVFLSALKSLHHRAGIEGGDAVIDIRSITTGNKFNNPDKFICRDGRFVSRVYLQGEVVLLK